MCCGGEKVNSCMVLVLLRIVLDKFSGLCDHQGKKNDKFEGANLLKAKALTVHP